MTLRHWTDQAAYEDAVFEAEQRRPNAARPITQADLDLLDEDIAGLYRAEPDEPPGWLIIVPLWFCGLAFIAALWMGKVF